jgi:hypothetical protein
MQDLRERASVSAWEEFGTAQLGDKRRTERLVAITTRVLERPGGTIPRVFDNPAELHGAYDFVENDHVDPAAIVAAAAHATARRARGLPFVWIVTDGTSRSVTDRAGVKGTGRVGSGNAKGRGDQVHDALVLDPAGVPLGIAALEQWQRGPRKTRAQRARRATAQKETQRWLNARAAARATLAEVCPDVVRHYLHDRGADAWPVILDAVESRPGEYTTIRASWDRRLCDAADAPADAPTCHLRDALAAAPVVGTYGLAVPAGPRRAARDATMAVRACRVTLDLKDKRTEVHHAATVWAVCAREVSAVPVDEKPLEWMLLTTYPVTTFADAEFVLGGYALRWRVEQFHAAWKSTGTDVEASQLAAPDHRARWGIILAVVAATLLRWQLLATHAPETPAEREFTPEQLEAVRDLQKDEVVPETGPATLGQVVVALAYLGGWAGSKTRAPGVKVIARGWTDVMAYLRGKRRATQRAQRNVTPGPNEDVPR